MGHVTGQAYLFKRASVIRVVRSNEGLLEQATDTPRSDCEYMKIHIFELRKK